MKHRRPGASQRAEKRLRKKMIDGGFTTVNLKDIEAYREWISFGSLTLLPVNKHTRSTTFIVRTKKPLRWGDFIEKVTQALGELLV